MSSVEFFFENIAAFEIKKDFISSEIDKLIVNEKMQAGDLSVIFCSDKYLLEMNKKHLEHDYYTDIITFNYVSGNLISGDLFISIDRVRENAIKFNTDFCQELYRVIFHGVLHLIGYNDTTSSDKQLMRLKENEYLEKIDLGK